jgi:23S rRNA (cytidine1920-2'-O)/16S rRNA (cytidine1409-2'-O)-methyltransferase
MNKERLDKILVDRGLAETRQKAQAMIMAGLVFHGQERLDKPGRMIAVDLPLIVAKPLPYVGRGGLKLEEALDVFKIVVEGRICADIGSSTGGFTDCLLKRGAARVYAVDVDIRQLDARLRADARVATVEKNARYLEPADFVDAPSLVVMDVSFISILKVLPALKRVLADKTCDSHLEEEEIATSPRRSGAPHNDTSLRERSVSPFSARNDNLLLSLIKPQFEAGRGQVGKKGLVRDSVVHRSVLAGVARGAEDLGFRLLGLMRCSTRGQKGNQEFFALWSVAGDFPAIGTVEAWIAAAVAETPSG